MVLAIKHRASFYKRFELDIWGILRTSAFRFRTGKPKKNFRRKNLRSSRFSRRSGAKPLFSTRVSNSNFRNFSKRKIMAEAKNKNALSVWSKSLKTRRITSISGQRGTKKSLFLRIHSLPPKKAKNFFLTYYYSKLMRIFNFFYSKHLKQQEYKMRARRRYVYRLDIIQRRVFKKKIKKRFVSLRLVKLFYLTLNYRQFRQLAQRTRRLQGCFEHNFLLSLEGRLLSFIYRTSLIPNLFQCLRLVRSGELIVDNALQSYVNYKVALNSLVTFTPLTKRLVYLSLLYRLSRKLILFNPPRYMFVSYVFLFCYMKRPPQRRDLVFPVSLDMYRATGYAF